MIAIGCDHGGYELKQKILAHLKERGLEYKDFGCDSTASVDYPVYGRWNGSPSITKSPAARKKPCGPSGKQVCRLDWS